MSKSTSRVIEELLAAQPEERKAILHAWGQQRFADGLKEAARRAEREQQAAEEEKNFSHPPDGR